MSRTIIAVLILGLCISFTACGGGGGGGNDIVTTTVPDDYGAIQIAIDASDDGVIIVVRDGTYTGASNKNLDFGGKAITLRSENGAENCVIDCEGDGRGFNFHNGETSASVVDGFKVVNAVANSNGGAIYCNGSSPIIRNCVISGAVADFGGGISCENSSSPQIINCTIENNTAEYGGGIYCLNSSSPVVMSCEINGNDGGGICCQGSSSPNISDCIIIDNIASTFAAGISCFESSSPDIMNCVISGNSSAGNVGESETGGGILCQDSSDPEITNCLIIGNSSAFLGGGIYCYASSPDVINCVISGNMAGSAGGGGGGIACAGLSASPFIAHGTIVDNSATDATGDGGGILCMSSSSATVIDCVLWDNSAVGDGQQIALRSPSTLTISYSDVEGGQTEVWTEASTTLLWGLGNIGTTSLDDPLFVVRPSGTATAVSYDADTYQSTLVDSSASFTPGALTGLILVPNTADGSQFVIASNNANSIIAWGDITAVAATSAPFDDYEVKDYHIRAASPCIDAGTDTGLDTDIDGDARPQDFEVDMGADEYSG